jgi:hypothetical protein
VSARSAAGHGVTLDAPMAASSLSAPRATDASPSAASAAASLLARSASRLARLSWMRHRPEQHLASARRRPSRGAPHTTQARSGLGAGGIREGVRNAFIRCLPTTVGLIKPVWVELGLDLLAP